MPILLLFIVSVIYFYLFGFQGIHGDESFQLAVLSRMVNGEIPWRDFFLHLPPLSFTYSKMFYQVFSSGVVGFRISIFLSLFGMVVTNFFIANHYLKSRYKAFFAALFSLVWSPVILPINSYTPLACLFLGLSILLALKTNRDSLAFFFFCSILTALAFLSKQSYGLCGLVVFMYRFVGFFSREKFRMIVPAIFLTLIGISVTFILVLWPYYGHLNVMWAQVMSPLLALNQIPVVFPFELKGLKSLVLGALVVVAFLAIAKMKDSNPRLFKRFQLLAGVLGLALVVYTCINPNRVNVFLNHYFTTYSHNLIFVLLICLVLRFLVNPRNYFIHFIASSVLFYFINSFGPIDLSTVLVSSYFLFFTFQIWLLMLDAYGLVVLSYCFAISLHLSSSVSLNSMSLNEDVPLIEKIMNHTPDLDQGIKDCVSFINQSKAYVFQSPDSKLTYYQLHQKNYYWYFLPIFSNSDFEQALFKELVSKDFDYIWFSGNERDLIAPYLPKFSDFIDENFELIEHPSCKNLHGSKRILAKDIETKYHRPMIRN